MYVLIMIVLIIIAVLMIMTGSLFVAGTINQQERHRAIWFLIAMIGGAIWALTSGALTWGLQNGALVYSWLSYGICFGSLMAGIGLLGYCLPHSKFGKPFLYVIIGTSGLLMLVPFVDFSLLAGVVQGNINWFYICYILLIAIIFLATIACAILRVRNARTHQDKNSAAWFAIGLTVMLAVCTVSNVFLPFLCHVNTLLWIGPLSIYILMLTFYFSLFAQRRIFLQSAWLKRLSYLVIVCSAIILYTAIVFGVAILAFNLSLPQPVAISIFAIIISLILLIIVSVGYNLTASIRSLLLIGKIDLAYVISHIDLATKKSNYKQLATFLAGHLHVSYVGLLIKDRLYESYPLKIDAAIIQKIKKIPVETHTIWQTADLETSYKLLELNLAGVAQLRTDNGVVLGQVIIGKPEGKLKFGRRDFLIIEMILNLVATSLDQEKPASK